MDTSVITDTLLDNDYAYVAKEDLYRRDLPSGEYIEVAFEDKDTTVVIARYNSNNKQLNFEEVSLRNSTDVQRVLRIVR